MQISSHVHNITYRNLGSEYTHGVYTGSISSGDVIDVGYKPKYIYLKYNVSTGTNTYRNLYIHFVTGYSENICLTYQLNHTIGSSNTTVGREHVEDDITNYITLTETGFISKKAYENSLIVY